MKSLEVLTTQQKAWTDYLIGLGYLIVGVMTAAEQKYSEGMHAVIHYAKQESV